MKIACIGLISQEQRALSGSAALTPSGGTKSKQAASPSAEPLDAVALQERRQLGGNLGRAVWGKGTRLARPSSTTPLVDVGVGGADEIGDDHVTVSDRGSTAQAHQEGLRSRLEYLEGMGLSEQAIVRAVHRFPNLLTLSVDSMESKRAWLIGAGVRRAHLGRVVQKFPQVRLCTVL